MLCYILAQYALFIYKNILLFFDIKKQSHLNCCRILNINLVIGICKSNSNKLQMIPTLTRHLQIQFQQVADDSDPRICICKFISNKLQMLPTPTRHLQIQFQQIADASNPGQASAAPIPASCRCFRPRPGIYKSNSSKLQMLTTLTRHLQIQFQQVADDSDPRICICKFISNKLQMLPTPTRHLQIQFQQIADASNPGQASAAPIPASCRCFRPRPGIYKSNSSKLQMLTTLTRHLQIQFQQVADDSDPRICICKFISNKLQMLPNLTRHLQIQFQQVADASDPDQASVAPKTTNQRCPPVNFLLKFAGGHLYCISISSNSYICLFLIHRGLSRPVSWHLFWTFPVFHRFPYALLWKSLPTRPLLLLSVPDGFCPR